MMIMIMISLLHPFYITPNAGETLFIKDLLSAGSRKYIIQQQKQYQHKTANYTEMTDKRQQNSQHLYFTSKQHFQQI